MTETSRYVGIDVSQQWLDVGIRPADGPAERAANDAAGIDALVGQLAALGPARIVLEATGGLEQPLVAALAAAGLPVALVNPRQVRDFARATGRLAKTDALDAAVLAHFAEAVPLPLRALLAQLPELGQVDRRPGRGPGRRRPLQPRQRPLARPTQHLGRSRHGPRRALHGRPRRHPLQPRDQRLLPAPARPGQAQKGRAHRLYAQTAGHPQRHPPEQHPLASSSTRLTSKTVALSLCDISPRKGGEGN